jgi:hypothetical protein
VILGPFAGTFDCGLGAGAGVSGALSRMIGSRLDRVSAGEHLLGALAFGGHRVHGAGGWGIVEIGLLIVEKHLVLVASALGVVEDVLRRGAARLRELCLDLAAILVGVVRIVVWTSVDVVVELGLLLVEVLLLAIFDRLLAVTESLLQAGDALIGVQALLCSVLQHDHAFGSVGKKVSSAGLGRAKR